MEALKEKNCPVCQGSSWQLYFSGNKFSLYSCTNCQLITTVTQTGIEKQFPPTSIYEDENEALMQFKDRSQDYQSYAKNILDFANTKSGTLLDIGCGLGWIVKQGKERGFKSLGIDQAEVYTRVGRQKLQVNLKNISLEELQTSDIYDLITLNHVLEHIQDPNNFLNKIKHLLSNRGEVVIAVPNINSLMFKIFKSRWYGLLPSQHLWQFTPKTLTKLLEENNFTVAKNQTTNLDYNINGIKKIFFSIILIVGPLIGLGDQIFLSANDKK